MVELHLMDTPQQQFNGQFWKSQCYSIKIMNSGHPAIPYNKHLFGPYELTRSLTTPTNN